MRKWGTGHSGGKGDRFGPWDGGRLPIGMIIRPKPIDSGSAELRCRLQDRRQLFHNLVMSGLPVIGSKYLDQFE